jgi:hypothetical protein
VLGDGLLDGRLPPVVELFEAQPQTVHRIVRADAEEPVDRRANGRFGVVIGITDAEILIVEGLQEGIFLTDSLAAQNRLRRRAERLRNVLELRPSRLPSVLVATPARFARSDCFQPF